MTVIEARGLRKDFTVRVSVGWLRRRTHVVAAVDGVDLIVERGEMLGYIGPNGAGKSTTLKMLTGVLYPSGGDVRVCGLVPVPQRTRLARRIGVVFGLGFGFVAYLPALALLGRPDPLGTPAWLHWCSPVTALLAASVAGLLWRTGIRHYRSTGS